jgi:hypothetical protein
VSKNSPKNLKHVNLFHYCENKKEVYAAFQGHYNRDTWIQHWWHIVLIGCALGAVVVSGHKDWLWLFGGLHAMERAISCYVDNSNRNWLMHAIDWYECEEGRKEGRSPPRSGRV